MNEFNDQINCSEWKNAGECIVEGNQVLGTRIQTLSYGNYNETQDVKCYKDKKEGKTYNSTLLHNYSNLILIKFLWRESPYPDRRH